MRVCMACFATFLMLTACVSANAAEPPLSEDVSRRIIAEISTGEIAALLKELPSKEGLNVRLSSGDTPLIAAAALGERVIAEALLNRGADPDGTSERGWTPLMTAVFFGNREIVNLLLQQGAKTDVAGADGATARSIALWRGYLDLAEKFPSIARKSTEASLVAAVETGDYTAMDALLAAGVSPTATDTAGNPALLVAAASGDAGAVGRLLKAGAPADLIARSGVTPLMVAVQQNKPEVVELLIGAGADPLRRADKGNSSVEIAYMLGNEGIAHLLESKIRSRPNDETSVTELSAAAGDDHVARAASLIKAGASPDGGWVHGRKIVPLSVAAFSGATSTVIFLLDKGASVDRQDDYGNTPLMAAIVGNHADTAAVLVKHGANTKIANRDRVTPASMGRAAGWLKLGDVDLFSEDDFVDAVKKDDGATVREMLVEHGNWATERDEHGWVPMMYAAQDGGLAVVKALWQNGARADLSEGDYDVPSPLILAAEGGKLDVVDLLLSYGADPTYKDSNGQTAADRARRKGNTSVAASLAAAEKTYARAVTSGLAALGFLARVDDGWDDRDKKALARFYEKFIALAPFPAPVALKKAMEATLRICNGSGSKIFYAMVFSPTTDGSVKSQLVDGWWPVDPGGCTWLMVGDVLHDLPPDKEIWVYAISTSSWTWGGDRPLCLPKDHSRLEHFAANTPPDCLNNEAPASFYRIVPYQSSNPVIVKGPAK